jgi:hypothetical protein
MKAYAVANTTPSRSRKPIRRSPIRHKPRRRQSGDNPAYRAFVRTFGCVACFGGLIRSDEEYWVWGTNLLVGFSMKPRQTSKTECAHVGHRGLSQKCPDCESLPLCRVEHHRIGPESHHKLGKRFWSFHGLDRAESIKQMQKLWAEESGRPVLGSAP